MPVKDGGVAPPSDDKRWRLVDATMRRHGFEPNALIETLHTVQESFGFLDPVSMRYIAESLRVPLSKVYGVATFYHFFSMRPPGKHSCVVCLGTACYIKGGMNLLDAVSEAYEVEPGKTTDNGELSLLTARCIGSCGLAPAVVLDSAVTPKQTPQELLQKIERLTDGS